MIFVILLNKNIKQYNKYTVIIAFNGNFKIGHLINISLFYSTTVKLL